MTKNKPPSQRQLKAGELIRRALAEILAKENIESVEVIDFEELGMEAVRKIKVRDFPAFIITDDKGNDFFSNLK